MSTNSSYLGNGYWWLRSPIINYYNYYVRFVMPYGSVSDQSRVNSNDGVRAVIEITIYESKKIKY